MEDSEDYKLMYERAARAYKFLGDSAMQRIQDVLKELEGQNDHRSSAIAEHLLHLILDTDKANAILAGRDDEE